MALGGCVWATDPDKDFFISLQACAQKALTGKALAGSSFPDRIGRYKVV